MAVDNKQKLLRISTDLYRISYWLYRGQDKLAYQFLRHCHQFYSHLNCPIGKSDLKTQLNLLTNSHESRAHTAERALTTSLLLLHQARKAN